MLANPPASAGTAPPPLWDSARPRVRLSSHDSCRGCGDLCLLGARASRRRRVFRGSWRRRRPGAPRALRRVRRQVHLEPRPHRVFAPCGAVRVPETGRLPRFALVPRLVQSSRPVPFRVVCVLMRGLPGRRAVNFRRRGTVIESPPPASTGIVARRRATTSSTCPSSNAMRGHQTRIAPLRLALAYRLK